MWKIVAVFLLLLVLSAVSYFNKESLSWMLTLFFALIGVGIFIYTYGMVFKENKSKNDITNIKSAMGSPDFSDLKKKADAPPIDVPEVETPKISEPEHPADAAEHNEILVPPVEVPSKTALEPVPEKTAEAPTSMPEQPRDEPKVPESEVVSLDFGKLRSKLKRGTTGYDDDDDKNIKN
ncbi:MAG: hypothetical protein ABIG96_05415 [Candidatus Micrarchaeota archaeon]